MMAYFDGEAFIRHNGVILVILVIQDTIFFPGDDLLGNELAIFPSLLFEKKDGSSD